jgi:hypothetical protein
MKSNTYTDEARFTVQVGLGSKAFPIAAEQNIGLGALDVDFEEVDTAHTVRFA